MPKSTLRRVLVVDDEPEILAEVAGFLRRRGEVVVTASSCAQGRRALDDDTVPIDILLTDARMPDGSGLELVRLAVERPDGPVMCILMTGHVEQGDLAADLQDAGVKVIYKPFSLAAMYRDLCCAWDAEHPGEAPVELVHAGDRAHTGKPSSP